MGSHGWPAQLFSQEAWCDPVQATQYMLDQAAHHGAQLHYGEAVQELTLQACETTRLVTGG